MEILGHDIAIHTLVKLSLPLRALLYVFYKMCLMMTFGWNCQLRNRVLSESVVVALFLLEVLILSIVAAAVFKVVDI
jgi:hypothetical protein